RGVLICHYRGNFIACNHELCAAGHRTIADVDPPHLNPRIQSLGQPGTFDCCSDLWWSGSFGTTLGVPDIPDLRGTTCRPPVPSTAAWRPCRQECSTIE